MPSYEYRARERAGQVRAGVLEAENEAEALSLLEAQGLLPIRIARGAAEARKEGAPRAGLFAKRVPARELIAYTRQLETMLESGIPLSQCLVILADQTPCEPLRDATTRVRAQVEQGSGFSEALAREPRAYPPLYVNMVRAGEEGGALNSMLERTATLLEHEAETKERVRSALFYPQLIVGQLLLAMVVLIKVVLPRYSAFFSGMGAELPLPTRMLMRFSAFIEHNGLLVLAGLALAVFATYAYSRTPGGRWTFDSALLRAPIFGPIVLKSIMSRFSRVLASLLASGVPILQSLEITRRVAQNLVVEKEISLMQEGIVSGGGVTGTLKDSRVFPPLVVKMLAVGEETGALDRMLLKVSAYFDRDVEYAVKNLTAAIEPILLVVMGGAVLFVALAVFLPMWNLMHAVVH